MRTVSVTWATAHQHGEAWISHHRLRYRMFVERQKWSVPNYQEIEYDEFDTPAATYILAVDEQYRALGATRLIPTTRPYMVGVAMAGAGGRGTAALRLDLGGIPVRLRPRSRCRQSASGGGTVDTGVPRVWNCNWHKAISGSHADPNIQKCDRRKPLPCGSNRTNPSIEWTRDRCGLYRCISFDT